MDKIKVGVLYNTHGLQGEAKVKALSDSIEERFKVKGELIAVSEFQETTLTITHCKQNKDHLILRFKGYHSINDIEKLKGSVLYVTRDSINELDQGVYYFDLMGCQVFDQEDQLLGIVEDVLETGANPVLRVNQKILIPFVDAFILECNLKEKRIKMNIIDGLI